MDNREAKYLITRIMEVINETEDYDPDCQAYVTDKEKSLAYDEIKEVLRGWEL